MQDSSLCSKCNNSIWCDTWAEWKCTAQNKRIYNYKELTGCTDFVPRPKTWKEVPCSCESCLDNDDLFELREENNCKY